MCPNAKFGVFMTLYFFEFWGSPGGYHEPEIHLSENTVQV